MRDIMANKFIHYDVKKGVEYASVYTPQRVDGIKVNNPEYLGRVVNKEKGIYQSRARGIFQYTIEGGYCDMLIPSCLQDERYILDFGSSYIFYEMLKGSPYYAIIKESFPEFSDTLLTLIGYRVLEHKANSYALDWWEGDYVRILFPNAKLKSQRVSDLLKVIGQESLQRHFFKRYLSTITSCNKPVGLLIDSTALPNDIHFPLTALHTEFNTPSKEAKLILVVERTTNMPLFFRYTAGNIIDTSTLKETIRELSACGVKTEFAIVDAGYYSEGNIRELYSEKISFLTRVVPNRVMYKNLAVEHLADLLTSKYLIKYGERLLHIKRVEVPLFDNVAYAYIAIDLGRRNEESYKYVVSALEDKVAPEEIDEKLKTKGMFILISSEKIATGEILPLYYSRQAIEQIFDINKNNVELLPLRCHSEETFRGHLMLSFLSSVAYLVAQNRLKGSAFNPIGAFAALRNLKCKVYDKKLLVKEPTKKMKEIANIMNLTLPTAL
jgi:hypothetical protein